MMETTVSIIIPTFNRANYIGETLDSILEQTYKNWECIVVDDRSEDYTDELMEFYCGLDGRIKYWKRPKDRCRGANACRNFGLEKSGGGYINWFDSDDLMDPQNIELKLNAIIESGSDIIISNSVNFDENGKEGRQYRLDYDLEITAENYIGGRIGWITNDALIVRNVISIKFDERLQSHQEYNFFSRLLLNDLKINYLKMDLAKRRLHPGSIQGKLSGYDKRNKEIELFKNELILYDAIKDKANLRLLNRSLRRLIRFSYNDVSKFNISEQQLKTLNRLGNKKFISAAIYFLFWMITNGLTGRGYYFLNKSLKQLDR